MKIISEKISIKELDEIAKNMYGNLVKAVVDIKKEILAVDGELHADEEALLLEEGSEQKDLWGINLYPQLKGDDFIEFDSVINIRPSMGNKTRSVDDGKTKEQIKTIVNRLISR